jgi:triosephosphate isomerase
VRERIVAGNWKMHGSRDFVRRWAGDFRPGTGSTTVLLIPPVVLLSGLVDACGERGVEYGVQTIHPEPEGAFTGEISAEMAADAGAGWTLIGHSERRLHHHEDDAAVAARFGAPVPRRRWSCGSCTR